VATKPKYNQKKTRLRGFIIRASNLMKTQAIKTGPKRIATSTGKPAQRQRDNKETQGNTPSLKPSKSTTKK
jgi:hypothetical protein